MEKIALQDGWIRQEGQAGGRSRILKTEDFPKDWRSGRVFLEVSGKGAGKALLGNSILPVVLEGTPFSARAFELTEGLSACGSRAVLTLMEEEEEKVPVLCFAKKTFLSDAGVISTKKGLRVRFFLHAGEAYQGQVEIQSDILKKPLVSGIACAPGDHRLQFWIPGENLVPDAARWEMGSGALHSATIQAEHLEEVTCRFGIRVVESDDAGHLVLNRQRVFFFGETAAGLAPEGTGKSWEEIIALYQSYGITLLRFAGQVPGEEALAAADAAGMAVLVELPNTSLADAAGTARTERYLSRLALLAASHPCILFAALGTGLSLQEAEGKTAQALLSKARKENPSLLYAASTNPEAGRGGPLAGDDFFCSTGFFGEPLRDTGRADAGHPEGRPSYDGVLARIREHFSGPVLSMDAGMFATLPELPTAAERKKSREADLFARMVEAAGLEKTWEKNREAAAHLSLLLKQREAERALRTRELAGICFRGLADEPERNLYAGILRKNLSPKPGAPSPEEVRSALCVKRPLLLADRRCCLEGETLSVRAEVADYERVPVRGPWQIRLLDEKGGEIAAFPGLEDADCRPGTMTALGDEMIPVAGRNRARTVTLSLTVGEEETSEKIWIYPPFAENYTEVTVTENLAEAKPALEMGASVLLIPPAAPLRFPGSAPLSFAPWFGPFDQDQIPEETMGIRVDKRLRIFHDFATSDHADWQWQGILSGARAMVLPRSIPDEASLITAIDGPFGMRRLSALLSVRVGRGKLLLCSLGLWQKSGRPEARALLHGILSYIHSPAFSPKTEISMETLEQLVQ